MLKRFGVNSSCDNTETPGVELDPREEGEPKGDRPCREAVGSLMWLSTMTRPDISNAVRAAPRHFHTPRQAIESSPEDHVIRPRDKGCGFDFCKGFGIISDCIWRC